MRDLCGMREKPAVELRENMAPILRERELRLVVQLLRDRS
jgi:hypothetical protein